MGVMLDWKKLFDWISGIVLGIYVFVGIGTGALILAIMNTKLICGILILFPCLASIGYIVWRLIEKGRNRVKG